MDFLRALVDPSFMPHGHCYLWRPEMVWLQVVSNLLIGLSYTSISATLFVLARRMRPLPFQRAYLAFGLFIVSCGVTHFMDIVTVWRGVYWLDGAIRAFTALASAATALWLFPLFPQVVSFGKLISAERETSRSALESELRRTRELQAALVGREAQLREVVDNLPDLAWWAKPDGHIEFYNRRWYEYTGTVAADMEGWGWRSVHDPAMIDAVIDRWQRSLESGESFEMEFPLRGADGTYRWFLTRVRPLRGADGKIERWIGTNTDIDDRRRAQTELQRSLLARDEFISVASHELRTPLASLVLQLGVAQRAIARGDDAAKIAARLEVADRQQQRLSVLVEEMLDVSQISLGKLVLDRADTDVSSLVASVVSRLQEPATRAGSSVTIHVGTTPIVGTWDASRLGQVFTNLINNAIEYGKGQPIEVSVEDGAQLRIDVRDHGIGIESSDLERVFERYERAVSSRHFGGLGLGLYISRQIVEAHGGTLTVSSTPGEGSIFSVLLPRHATTETA